MNMVSLIIVLSTTLIHGSIRKKMEYDVAPDMIYFMRNMLYDKSSEAKAKEDSQLDTTRGSTVKLKRFEEILVKGKSGSSRHNEPLQAVVENKLHDSALNEENSSILERNRALLQYIATLANSNDNQDQFNYEFVQSLLKGGAEINTADQYGQSIFHEVSRSWNVDVAKFLLKHGCDINKQDSFGRTPLHVSAAVNHSKMTEFLVQNNANIDARTFGDEQAAIHYAAKNGAAQSLKVLLGYNANIDALDANKKTPLQLAAEWTRQETAKILIEEGAASCSPDSSGYTPLCVLIDRMPNLALIALNQLHKRDVISMKDYYHLQHLETSRQNYETKSTRTALETAVATRKFEVVTHPVMQRLILNKWIKYGRLSTIFDLLFHAVFGIMWTAVCLGTPKSGRDLYIPLEDHVWRIVIGLIIILLTIYDIGNHAYATKKLQKSKKNWMDWRISQLENDMKYCHPRWPQERKYIEYEISRVKSLPQSNEFGAWFYLDWIVLILIIATIVSHFIFFVEDSYVSRYVYTRVISIMNLLVWLRLLKYVRPFPGIGTLVIILGETSGDFVNWGFLFFLLLIPFSSAFWLNFGPLSVHSIHGYHEAPELLYTVFQIAVGDNFNLDGIVEADEVMARILVVLYVTAVTIVTLNLLIALLSDTFTRVYSNAVANTIMQRAIKVVESERTLPKKKKIQYREYMKTSCSPEVLDMSCDGKDVGSTSEKTKMDMISDIGIIKKVIDDRFSKVYGQTTSCDFDTILDGVRTVKDKQGDLTNDIMDIKELVNKVKGSQESRRYIAKSNEENRNGGGSSVSNFFGRISSKKKIDETKSKRQAEEKESGRSRDKRNKRRKNKQEDKQNGKESHASFSSTSIVPYKEPLHTETHSGRANQGFSKESTTMFEDDEISL